MKFAKVVAFSCVAAGLVLATVHLWLPLVLATGNGCGNGQGGFACRT